MGVLTHKFDLDSKSHTSIIKVIGVGGGGSNAVTNMYKRGIQDVSFVVCNTDEQALRSSPVPNQLQIGVNLTKGLGAGANPDVGKNAALESKDDIESLLSENTKMIFVTAGMGGGTGTGAAPVISSIASKLGILTVGIVTMPFSFEGRKKMIQAQAGVDEMRQYCDTLIVILNDKISEIYKSLKLSDAFAQADNVLTTAAKSIAEMITVPGYVNVDFEDVKTVMKKAGPAMMGSAEAEGENRAQKAAEQALNSPLLSYTKINGAQKILLSIVSGTEAELQMDELSTITEYIQSRIGTDADMIFGHSIDKEMKEKICVTIIATGFEENENTENVSLIPDNKNLSKKTETVKTVENKEAEKTTIDKPVTPPEPVQQAVSEPAQQQIKKFNINDEKSINEFTDIPTYKRLGIKIESDSTPNNSNAIIHKLN